MSLTIKGRVALTSAMLSVLMGCISACGIIGLVQNQTKFNAVAHNEMPGMVSISNSALFASRERLSFDRALQTIGTPASVNAQEAHKDLRQKSDEYWGTFYQLEHHAESQRLADIGAAKRAALQQLIDEGFAAIAANDKDKALTIADQIVPVYNALLAANVDLLTFLGDKAENNYRNAVSTYHSVLTLDIVALLAGLSTALFSFLMLRRALSRPLARTLAQFDAIAAGDLRRPVEVTSNDEMGQILLGLAKMQESLVMTVRSVRSGSESIASATQQIAAGNADLSSRTEEQASALQETSASMEHLTGIVRQNADNARQASALAVSASTIANQGNTVVSQVVSTMSEINDSSAKIADIIAIIEGIAFQTNILALNAAVEAARAGEEGRGFAVVAGEVRNLAQRSSAAAKEIKVLIDASVNRVQSGSTLVDQAGRTMYDIIGAVQRVTDIMGEISASSVEQSGGIEQIARAVSQMDEATQQNAALVEEAAAAAQSLQNQASLLNQTVAVFQLGGVASASGRAFGAPVNGQSTLRQNASAWAGAAV
ncbi:MAG: methyl-accepting chemotaxis protein [Janthinobacterium lividum]